MTKNLVRRMSPEAHIDILLSEWHPRRELITPTYQEGLKRLAHFYHVMPNYARRDESYIRARAEQIKEILSAYCPVALLTSPNIFVREYASLQIKQQKRKGLNGNAQPDLCS